MPSEPAPKRYTVHRVDILLETEGPGDVMLGDQAKNCTRCRIYYQGGSPPRGKYQLQASFESIVAAALYVLSNCYFLYSVCSNNSPSLGHMLQEK